MNKLKLRAFKAAFGGIIAALSVVLMFMTGLVPTMTYAIPAVSGALLMMLVLEAGSGFAFSVYIAVGILSLFLVADKEAAVMYVLFFGYYPIFKAFLEKHLKKMVCWVAKYIVFNISMLASYFIVAEVLKMPFDDMGNFGRYAMLLLLAAGNVVFFVYDIALTRLVSAYLYKWQKYIKRIFR